MKYTQQFKDEILSFYTAYGWAKTLKKYQMGRNVFRGWINPLIAKKDIKRTTEYRVNRYKNDSEYAAQKSKEVSCWITQKKQKDPQWKALCNKRSRLWEAEKCKIDINFKEQLILRRKINRRNRKSKMKDLNELYTLNDKNHTFEIFNNKCACCGAESNLHIDHWLPLSRGYALSRTNAVVLCKTCNAKKSNKMPYEFFTKEVYDQIQSKLVETNAQ